MYTRARLNRKLGWLATVIMISVGLWFLIGLSNHPAVPNEANTSGNTNSQGSATSQAQGIPAIVPKQGAKGGGMPAFSAQDAASFVASHPMPQSTLTDYPQVEQVRFMKSQEISALLHGETTGVSDDTLLCYVVVAGNFTYSGPEGKLITYHTGYEVFDATSGNLLLVGEE